MAKKKKKAKKLRKTKKFSHVLKIPDESESILLEPLNKELPSKSELEKLTGKKMVELREHCLERFIETGEHYYSLNQLKRFSKIRNFFKTFNSQLVKACLKPSFLRKEVKAHQDVFTWFIEENGFVPLTLPENITKGGVEYVLKKSKDSIYIDNVVTWSPTGKPKMIHINDTDREVFFDYVGPKIIKNRKSGGPILSATAVAIGTEIKAPNGEFYVAQKFGKSQRWVKKS